MIIIKKIIFSPPPIKLTLLSDFEDKTREALPPLKQIRERCIDHLSQMRPDHMRRLNPTPYKVNIHYANVCAQIEPFEHSVTLLLLVS